MIEPKARRSLTGVDSWAIGLNAIVGSGVFALPDDVRAAAGIWAPLAYIVCALLLLPTAYCFAKLARSTSESGGPLAYAARSFSGRWVYLIGISCWFNGMLSFAANASLLGALLFPDRLRSAAFSCVLVLVLGAVNVWGVRPSLWTIRGFVIAKMLAIVFFVMVGSYFFLSGMAPQVSQLAAPESDELGFRKYSFGFGQAVFLALFALQGFEVIGVPSGEAKDPERHVPLATWGTLLLAAGMYSVVQLLVDSIHGPFAEQTMTPLVDTARIIHHQAARVIAWAAFASIAGFVAGSAFGAPRYAEAMAAQGLLPSSLGQRHARFQTPWLAIVFTTVPAALLTLITDYRQLIGFSNVTVVIQYVVTAITAYRLRESKWLAALSVASSLTLLFFADRNEYLFFAATMVVAWFAQRLWKR